MKLVIISGRSGTGKGTALNILEDLGYFAIDNLPAGLILEMVRQVGLEESSADIKVAVSIDARNFPDHLIKFPSILSSLTESGIECEVIFLEADDRTLIRRFSETRRRHPLSTEGVSLAEALGKEQEVLESISLLADLTISTSDLTLHQLRDVVRSRVAGHTGQRMSLLFESFGFKNGVPADVDLVFDVRCLPNPHWDPALREQTGRDGPVMDYLDGHTVVNDMYQDICTFLDKWLGHFEENNRSYLTVGIGCTGGRHRSVYMAERLRSHYQARYANVQSRHRDMA